jgi:SAM-dependent methyltransferase/uncharacterized protein YbaR (Trm112 family)
VRLSHFEAFAPVCPRCRSQGRGEQRLVLACIELRDGDVVQEGILHCPSPDCRQEFPILDGVPIILAEVGPFLSHNAAHLLARDDLSGTLESLIGDAIGPGTPHDATRLHLSSYARDHYGMHDPDEAGGDAPPGAALRCLEAGFDLLGDWRGPALELGCAAGGVTQGMAARCDGLVLGVDLNISMLRFAQRVLATGRVRYARRRIGMVHDRRDFAAPLARPEAVDYWACDALALPFASGAFGMVAALNVLDAVQAPQMLLANIAALLRPGGGAVLACPYDWSPQATNPVAWIGGHSQRGDRGGAAEPLLRDLLTPGAHPMSISGLSIAGEIESFPWRVRLHDRSAVDYRAHILALRAG